MSHILKLVLIGALAIKVAFFLLSPAGQSQVAALIGNPSWADPAEVGTYAGYNSAADEDAGWGSRHDSGYDEPYDWDEAGREY